jgi:nickel-dependent lactate racemase
MKIVQAIRLDFSINCIYDQKGEIIRIIGGSLEQAYAASVELCFEKLGHRFEEKVDVSISSAFPHTHGHQIFKGLSTPDIVTKESGAILLVAPVVAPMNPDFLKSFHLLKEKSQGNTEAYVRAALARGEAFLPDKPIDFNMAMSTVFLRPKIRTILVSNFITREDALTIGLEYASSVEEALDTLKKAHPKATAAIFPVGGLIVPITAWQ